jgi:cytoskeletal protein RodZ
MKRCPQCLFIYPESDERCDFDQTQLVVVADSEIDSATKPKLHGNKNKFLFTVVAVVLLVVVSILVFSFTGNTNKTEAPASTNVSVAVAQETRPPIAPSPTPSVQPSPSPSPTPKSSPARVATSHTTTSVDPVSTSGPGMGTRRGGKPVILLTSGGKIEADEVWRTRDGIWYRKNGIVTLLKSNRVKAIVNH